jgi:hypothetical protein
MGRSGEFKAMRATRGLLRSKVLPAFALKHGWLFPRPANEIEVLRELGVL